MEDVAGILATSIRWAAPAAGLVISLMAWRRFSTPGIRLAVAGFALMLVGLAGRTVVPLFWQFSSEFSARELGSRLTAISIASSFFATLGVIILILSMRQLIANAIRAEGEHQSQGYPE